MRILPIFKSCVKRKIEYRNARRIMDNTYISDKLSSANQELLNNNIDSIARFADKKNCRLEFTRADGLFDNAIQMNVYSKPYCYIYQLGKQAYVDTIPKKIKGLAILPDNKTDKKDFMEIIKRTTKCILSENKKNNV